MTDTPHERHAKPHQTFSQKVQHVVHIAWLVVQYIFDRAADRIEEYWAVIRRELELFGGVGLVLLGLLNFQNGKNCDGNTTDYLSCTRPSTFYYYSAFEVIVVIFGAFLILIWLLERKRR